CARGCGSVPGLASDEATTFVFASRAIHPWIALAGRFSTACQSQYPARWPFKMSSMPIINLPEPEPEARPHTARLHASIGEHIQASGGAIPFARYMELALYAPGLGY